MEDNERPQTLISRRTGQEIIHWQWSFLDTRIFLHSYKWHASMKRKRRRKSVWKLLSKFTPAPTHTLTHTHRSRQETELCSCMTSFSAEKSLYGWLKAAAERLRGKRSHYKLWVVQQRLLFWMHIIHITTAHETTRLSFYYQGYQ